MQSNLIKNQNDFTADVYKIARVVYAETYAQSLRVVEALASMIANGARRNNQSELDFVMKSGLFESLDKKSKNHYLLKVNADARTFQMCVRVVDKMLKHHLDDCCFGATKFHRVELNPKWTWGRGYILELDGLLFYL
ncbi:MAG: hypothetical protein IKL95_01395 [Alphaproteobacteria bacterium]|nr:hypothetical protein [Alphaproteobacteria bacterium]